jgi:Predicted membrane protein (DUF2157)
MTEHADHPERADAVQTIVALARRHEITAEEIAAALGEPVAESAKRRSQAVLVRVLGVLGATFVFAGVAAFIALQWESLGPAARVIVTLGPGIAAFVLAVLAVRDPRFEKMATPLFLVTAALEPTGMAVALDEFGSGGDWRHAGLLISGTIGVQMALTFGALRKSSLLFLTVLFAEIFWWTTFDLLDVDGGPTALVLGSSLLLASVGIDRTRYANITPFWYFVGSAAFLAGLFDVVERTPLELLFLAAAASLVYLSAVLHTRTLLAVSTLAILGYTAWYTGEYFADSVGWPLALIGFGLFMIGLGAVAFRIDRVYVQERGDESARP